ncbi:hypothetical protein F2Q69_00037167 [Brassica cretica]|uniref:Uncharacterized protein n=1 Tax=Brassica cretica TaxID=69181 RepID=A0A8S9STD8_BRACR|nr:hypothetical protein F2Q69_00037167 [Brassica cretica]
MIDAEKEEIHLSKRGRFLFNVKLSHWFSLVSPRQSMIQSRPLPTIIDFNRLLSEVSRTKQKLGFAFSVMGKMLKLGYDPDTITSQL